MVSCSISNKHKLCKKCSEFKNGVFISYADTIRILIERKNDIQTETTSLGISKYKVTWESDCKYIIELLETTIPFSKQNVGRKYFVEILDIKNDICTYECRLDGTNITDKSTMKKVK